MNSVCAVEDREESALQYVGGRLAGDSEAAYEIHLLDCAACRAAVREAAAFRVALRPRSRRLQPLGVALLLAALVAGVMLVRPSELERLGRVALAPELTTIDVRASADSATLLINTGMEEYRNGRYQAAAHALAQAHALHADAGTAFFLGAAQLMNGQPDSAIASFGNVMAADHPAYRAEAHYYAAKAWLRLENVDSALAHLDVAAQWQPVGPAPALADSVRRTQQ